MYGPTAGDMKATGSTTRCMVEAPTNGVMGAPMKDNIKTTRNMDLDAIPGLMEKSTSANGKIAKGMEGGK